MNLASNSQLCNNQGTRNNNGTCSCNPPFGGATCNTCSDSDMSGSYPSCNLKNNGACCNRNAECASGDCEWFARGCDKCVA